MMLEEATDVIRNRVARDRDYLCVVKPDAMRIGLIDRAMFAVMSSTCVKELRKEHPEGTFHSK